MIREALQTGVSHVTRDVTVVSASSPPARAFWVEAEARGAIREVTLPALAPGFARVRARYSAISRGTEALVWAGRVPVSERERMRCPFQEGDFPFPVKYGYASVGRVVSGPSELAGRAVFC